jgi:hypothetical protein
MRSAHGNRRSVNDTAPFLCTPTETMEAINELTSKTITKAVYNKLITECDVDSAQLHKLQKLCATKNTTPTSSITNRSELAIA